MNRPDEWLLFEKLDEGRITEEEFEHLQKRLKAAPELRKTYRKYMDMVSGITVMLGDQAQEAWLNEINYTSDKGISKKRRFIYSLAVVAAVLFFAFWLGIPKDDPRDDLESTIVEPSGFHEEPIESGVVRIKQLAAVKWVDESFQQGAYLQNQRIKIEEGLLNLQFENGVDVVIEGPAEFKVFNEQVKLHVFNGKLTANVPKNGRGFTVITGLVDIVDLGTEFAVEVSEDRVEVQVLKGLVKLREKDRDIKVINAGEAFSVDQNIELSELEFNPKKFKGLEEIKVVKKDLTEKAHSRWKDFTEKRRKQPELSSHYSLGEDDFIFKRFVSAGRGRFSKPRSSVLFDQVKSRVTINIQEEMSEMTMMCWVKVKSTENLYNTIIHSSSRARGAPGWYFHRRTMLLSLHRPRGSTVLEANGSFRSPDLLKLSMLGRWIHIAVRITKDEVTFFRNGEVTSVSNNNVDYKHLKIGVSELGNSYKQAVRRGKPLNFHGEMEEFLIFNKGLSDSQIEEIFKEGDVPK